MFYILYLLVLQSYILVFYLKFHELHLCLKDVQSNQDYSYLWPSKKSYSLPMLSINNVANKTKMLVQPKQNKPIGTIHVLLHLENNQILKIISRFHKLYGRKTSIILLTSIGKFFDQIGIRCWPNSRMGHIYSKLP